MNFQSISSLPAAWFVLKYNAFPFTCPRLGLPHGLCLYCTGLVVFHIAFCVRAQISSVQMPIKRSPCALNLPAFLPRALEMEKGRPGVTALRVLIQRNPTAALFSLPTSLVSVSAPSATTRLSLRSEVRYYWRFIFNITSTCLCHCCYNSGQHYCFDVYSVLHLMVHFTHTVNPSRTRINISGTSCIFDLFAHLPRNCKLFSCPMTG